MSTDVSTSTLKPYPKEKNRNGENHSNENVSFLICQLSKHPLNQFSVQWLASNRLVFTCKYDCIGNFDFL
jgi:hypothetical protein